MDFFNAVILGVVEGITEFLPVSSTGHLILVERLLALPPTDFWKSFTVAIQLGAIGAVLASYWRKLFLNGAVFARVAVAFLPTAVVGLLLYPFIKRYLLGSATVVLWALGLGGIIIILFERVYREGWQAVGDVARMTYGQAFLIGIAQAVAVVPGVSRAAATIVGGLLVGLKRTTVVEFSFLLAIPTLAAATGLDLLATGTQFQAMEWAVLVSGFLVSFLSAGAAVRWLMRYIARHTFTAFGWYRLTLVAVWLVLLAML